MASRKRILALRRAPDGSAFQKCNLCGVSVAIALTDMHQCKVKKTGKKRSFKCVEETHQNLLLNNPSVLDQQPRSPFRIFMESFKKANQNDDWIDVDRKGFEAWKYMSMEERQCYVVLAEKVNSVYEQHLLEEMEDDKDGLEEEDEADSAWVGKIDLSYYDDTIDVWENSESFEYVMDHW